MHVDKATAYTTRNAWQSPAVARQTQRTHPREDTHLQRSNRRVCCLRDVICNRTRAFPSVHTPGVLWVHSAFLSLVTLTFDFWPWHSKPSERRTKHVFRVNLGQIRSAVPVPRWKARCRFRPISRHKIGCRSNVPWPIAKPIPDWTSTPTCLPPLKMMQDRAVVITDH